MSTREKIDNLKSILDRDLQPLVGQGTVDALIALLSESIYTQQVYVEEYEQEFDTDIVYNLNNSNVQRTIVTGSCDLSLINKKEGATYMIILKDVSGSHTVTLDESFGFISDNSAVTSPITTVANTVYLLNVVVSNFGTFTMIETSTPV